jgi:hypothetical protein
MVSLLAQVVQTTVGAVFAVACIAKWFSPDALTNTLTELTASKAELSRTTLRLLVRALATFEGVLGTAWYFGGRWAPAASMYFLVMASCGLIALRMRGYEHGCGCFGSGDAMLTPAARVVVNAVLIACVGFVWWLEFTRFSRHLG